MFKDPNHTEQTAYELLDLPLNAPLTQVRDALGRFVRERGRGPQRHLIGKAQQSHRDLQNAAARSEIDIWLFDVEVGAQGGLDAAPLELDDIARPQPLPPSELYHALLDPPVRPRREIIPRPARFTEIPGFDDMEQIESRPRFDR